MQPVTIPPGPLQVLALGAHPDDIEIGCGGTLLRIAARPDITLRGAILTGSSERAAEAAAALAAFCPGAVLESSTLPDGRLPGHWSQVKELLHDLANRFEPDLVLCPRVDDAHQDHREVCRLTWNSFRSHLILEYEIPKYDGDLGHPNMFVPVTKAMMERKIETLMACYATQANHQWFTPDTFAGLMRLRGIECDSPTGYAEAYHARKLIL